MSHIVTRLGLPARNLLDCPRHCFDVFPLLLGRALGTGGQLGGREEEAVEGAHVLGVQGHRLAVVGLGQLHVLEATLGVADLGVSGGDLSGNEDVKCSQKKEKPLKYRYVSLLLCQKLGKEKKRSMY